MVSLVSCLSFDCMHLARTGSVLRLHPPLCSIHLGACLPVKCKGAMVGSTEAASASPLVSLVTILAPSIPYFSPHAASFRSWFPKCVHLDPTPHCVVDVAKSTAGETTTSFVSRYSWRASPANGWSSSAVLSMLASLSVDPERSASHRFGRGVNGCLCCNWAYMETKQREPQRYDGVPRRQPLQPCQRDT